MTREEEALAVALWVIDWHGARAEVFVAEQIGALALTGDARGIARWQAIARGIEAMKERRVQ